MDQSLLAAPHGLTQRATSFIASQCQGIHQMPLKRLIDTQLSLAPTRRDQPTRRPEPFGKQSRHKHLRARCAQIATCSFAAACPLPGIPRFPFFSRCPRTGDASASPISMSSLTRSVSRGRRSGARRAKGALVPVAPKARWWRRSGSNRRPHACKARALPTELRPLTRGREWWANHRLPIAGGPGKI